MPSRTGCGRRLVAMGVLALAFAEGTALGQPRHPWPTKQFEIRTEIPPDLKRRVASAMAEEWRVQEFEVSPLVKSKMERHLNRVANHLESEGFRPPNLVVEKSTRNPPSPKGVYVVYLYNYPGGAPGSYHNACADPAFHFFASPYIRVDTLSEASAKVVYEIGTDHVTDWGYQVLTHELFHAVQYSYPFFRNVECAQGAWISEGTAKAFEIFVEEQLRGRQLLGTRSETTLDVADYLEKLQPRAYNQKLHVERNLPPNERSRAYATASFWMYLAEMAGAGPGRIPTLNGGKRDYRYLQELFETNAEGPGHEQELRWLNAGLKKIFERSLPTIYSEFVTMVAGYVPARAGPHDGGAEWRKHLFGKCPAYTLTESTPRVDFALVFEPVSARCVDISLSSRDEVELIVIARNKGGHITDVEAMAGLFVGVPGTHVVDQADIALPPDIVAEGEKAVGIWRVPLDPLIDPGIIISNIANVRVENPMNGPIALTILHPAWRSSFGGPPASAPRGKPDARGTPDAGRDASSGGPAKSAAGTFNSERRQAARRASRNLDTFSRTVKSSTGTRRRPAEGRCEEPFKFDICGPHSSISLNLSPGSFFDLGATSGRGGDFAQFSSNLLAAYAATGGSTARIEAWIKRQTSLPGHQINMTFPLIDYGFTGSFNNAYIEVKMPKSERWVTVGPQDAIPGAGMMFAFSGRVTIHEYTPEMLRGEFGGALVNVDDAEGAGDDPVLPVRHQLSGSFVIAAPVLDDDRTHVLNPMSYRDVTEDFEIIMPGMNAAAPDPIAAALEQSAKSPARRRSPSASVHEFCDCSCNRQADASGICRASCQWTYRACEGTAFIPPPLPNALSPSQETRAIAELRQKYYEFMVANKGRGYADQYIRLFDNLPGKLEDKRRWMELGGASEYIKWERAQASPKPAVEAPKASGMSPREEKAAISALRERFHEHVSKSLGKHAAKNFVEVYDMIPGNLEEKRKWVREAVPDFRDTLQ